MGPLDLFPVAQSVLSASVDAIASVQIADPTLLGVPARSYVSPGVPAFDDCEQLTVHVNAILESSGPRAVPLGRTAMTGRLNLVQFIIHITRCLPMGEAGEPPSATDLQAVARQIDADGWALWNHIYNLVRSKQLFAFCKEVFFDGERAIIPEGGYGGWRFELRAQIDGYGEGGT